MKHYPAEATEKFDNANFHINYCLFFIKKFLKGDILEVGAGCGSFTRNYINNKINNLILTDLDKNNVKKLKKEFKQNSKIKIYNKNILYSKRVNQCQFLYRFQNLNVEIHVFKINQY